MLKNFVLTSFRTFQRNKAYFGLGLLGLTLGISCVIALYSIINYQSSFDAHQEDGELIYRVTGAYKFGDDEGITPTVPHPLANGVREELPAVSAISNLFLMSEQVNIPQADGDIKKFMQPGIAFAQSDVFDILTFEWLAGGPDAFGRESVFISRELAGKFFDVSEGFHGLLGRELNLANKHTLQVQGIYENLPKKTDFPFNMIVPYEQQEGVNPYYGPTIWARLNGGTQCILKINRGSNPKNVEDNIRAAFEKYNVIEGYNLNLQALNQIHHDPVGNYSGITFIKEYKVLSYTLAIFLAIIGSINFINLSTARAIKRSKEVGIRKVMGSRRKDLILQFLLESMILVLIALCLSFVLAGQILIGFNHLFGFEIALGDIRPFDWMIFSTVVIVGMTFLSGFYPAMILSGFSPLVAIKTKISNIDKQSKIPLRKLLVGVQFGFSIILIICTLVIFSQMSYMKGFDMGFKSEDVISITFPEPDPEKQRRLQMILEAEPEFETTSLHLGSPMARTNNTDKYFNPEGSANEQITLTGKGVDEKYLEIFEIKLLSGRNLTSKSPDDVVLLTADALDKLHLGNPEEALSKTIEASWGKRFKIQGVVEAFKSQALNQEQVPAMLVYRSDQFYEMGIALSDVGKADVGASMKKLEGLWDEVYPSLLLQYDFLDEMIKSRYQFEDIMTKSTTFFVIIALIISILGLYGLTDYMANAKKKEIGIRKVVGAEVSQIMGIFLREVSILLAISFVVGSSISYFLMSRWLHGFDYRIEIGWEILSTSLLAICTIAFLTMGYRSYKAANINAVSVLKDE